MKNPQENLAILNIWSCNVTTSTRETTTRAWIYDVRMAQFVLKIETFCECIPSCRVDVTWCSHFALHSWVLWVEKLSHIMGPRGSQDLRYGSLYFIVNPWKVLDCQKSLKSPWIPLYGLEKSLNFPQHRIWSVTAKLHCEDYFVLILQKRQPKKTTKKWIKHEPKCEPTPDWSAVVYMCWNALVHGTWSLAWHYGIEALCWRLFCTKMPGKCSFNHKWLLIWFAQNGSLC